MSEEYLVNKDIVGILNMTSEEQYTYLIEKTGVNDTQEIISSIISAILRDKEMRDYAEELGHPGSRYGRHHKDLYRILSVIAIYLGKINNFKKLRQRQKDNFEKFLNNSRIGRL